MPETFLARFPVSVKSLSGTQGKKGRKNVHATIPKGNIRYDQYTVPDNVAVENTFLLLLWYSKHTHYTWPLR